MPERVVLHAWRFGRIGVGAEALEARVLFAGDVRVFVDDAGNLIVVGDGASNCVQIDMFGGFTVLGCDHGGGPTTVNGVPNGEAVFGVEDDDDIRIYMGDGDDEVRVGQRSDSVSPPDDLEIYPGHFAGSACGKAMSGKPSSTIGFERRFNEALRPRSRDEFVAFMTSDLPPQPEELERIRRINQGKDVERDEAVARG